MRNKTNIFDVAYFILETIGSDISTSKLQRLCFYCQAWHLVWYNKPLFCERYSVWQNGPVCRKLWNVHKGSFYMSNKDISQKLLSKKRLTVQEKSTIDKIIDYYGAKEGWWLGELIRNEAPYKNALENKKNTITQKSMKEYYESI